MIYIWFDYFFSLDHYDKQNDFHIDILMIINKTRGKNIAQAELWCKEKPKQKKNKTKKFNNVLNEESFFFLFQNFFFEIEEFAFETFIFLFFSYSRIIPCLIWYLVKFFALLFSHWLDTNKICFILLFRLEFFSVRISLHNINSFWLSENRKSFFQEFNFFTIIISWK